jgi:hypothetical protein
MGYFLCLVMQGDGAIAPEHPAPDTDNAQNL